MSEIYKYDNINISKLKFSIPEKQNNIYYSNLIMIISHYLYKHLS